MGKFSYKKVYFRSFILFKIYLSDNPEVDIKGANLFNMFLNKNRANNIEATNLKIESVLVCTGVYNPEIKKAKETVKNDIERVSRMSSSNLLIKHRVLENSIDDTELLQADTIVHDIFDVANHIIKCINS